METSAKTDVVDYSSKSIAVFGDTKPFKEQLKKAGGMFNGRLTRGSSTEAGWIFPISAKEKVSRILNPSASDPVESDDGEKVEALTCLDYTPKSIALFGDTKPIKEELKKLGGRYNPRLTHGSGTKAGWIFPPSLRSEVEAIIARENGKRQRDPVDYPTEDGRGDALGQGNESEAKKQKRSSECEEEASEDALDSKPPEDNH